MQARAPSARPRSGGCRPELRAARLDRAEALREARPRPRLDLAVSRRRLRPGRLEILEPGVRLLDQQELLGLALPRHGYLRVVIAADRRTPAGQSRWYP